jgi:hypothetical protein
MKTLALMTLLLLGSVAASGCHHWHDHRYNYSNGYYSR